MKHRLRWGQQHAHRHLFPHSRTTNGFVWWVHRVGVLAVAAALMVTATAVLAWRAAPWPLKVFAMIIAIVAVFVWVTGLP